MDILEIISYSLFSLIFIIIYTFLIYYISKSNLNKFSKRVLIIAFIMQIIARLTTRIVFALANFNFFQTILTYTVFDEIAIFSLVLNPINNLAYLLLLMGIASINLKNTTNNEKQHIDLIGRRRSIGISIFLFVITLGIYFPFWLYRTVNDLKRNFGNEISYSPGRAVGFIFIPIFNIFWFIYLIFSLPRAISKIENNYFNSNDGFSFRPVLISVLLLIIPVFSNLNYIANIDKSLLSNSFVEMQIFFSAALIYLWIMIQVKINEFFDFTQKLNT